MQLKDLENGMAVKFENGEIGMVFKDFMTWNYIMDRTIKVMSYGDNDSERYLEDCKIVEVRSVKKFCNDAFLHPKTMFNRGVVIWEKPKVTEMTLEEICKALGKNIKIVKGH